MGRGAEIGRQEARKSVRREAGGGRGEGKGNAMEKPHKKLDAWKLAMGLVEQVYGVTSRYPSEERFGLVDQMRRASVSVPSNIAEGAARQTRKEFINFLHVAQGSLSELDTLVELSCRLKFMSSAEAAALDQQMLRVDKTLGGLLRQQRGLVKRVNP